LALGIFLGPTKTAGVVALNAVDGERLWSAGADDAALRNVHYRTRERPFQAAPVVAGELVWIGGADGRLRGLALADGALLHLYDLGAPILAGVAPTANGLFVSTWDGTVRAMVTDPSSTDPPLPRGDEGCGCRAGHRGSFGAAGLLVLLALARRRWRRGSRR
jgi:hypothetical protein